MIQNYDTNGLIFALSPEAQFSNGNPVGHDFNSETYIDAISNILDSQDFFCIPIVSGQIPRLNKNNLMHRPVYDNPNNHKVTHIARKKVLSHENDIVFIPVEEIVHLKNTDSMMHCLFKLLSHHGRIEDGVSNFVVMIGGEEDLPEAIFTPVEIFNPSCKREIERRMAKAGIEISVIDNFFEKCREILAQNGDDEVIWDCHLPLKMWEFGDDGNKIMSNLRLSSEIKKDHWEGGVRALDIMTPVACGITVSRNSLSKSEKLAAEILGEANDFDNLIVYDSNNQLVSKVIRINHCKALNPLETPIVQIDTLTSLITKLMKNKDILIVEPNPKLVMGEGKMKWPGIITIEDVCSYEVIGFIGANMITMEGLFRRFLKNKNIQHVETGDRNTPIDKASLGQMSNYINSNRVLVDQLILSKTENGRKEFKNKTIQTTRFRNKIMHDLLKVFIGRPIFKKENISTEGRRMIGKINDYLLFHESIVQARQYNAKPSKPTIKPSQSEISEVLSQKQTIPTKRKEVDASTKDISQSKDLAALLKQLESELEKSPNDNEIRRAILNLKSEISLRDAQKLLDNHDG